MAPAPEQDRTSKEERMILSHSECKMWQGWPGVYRNGQLVNMEEQSLFLATNI